MKTTQIATPTPLIAETAPIPPAADWGLTIAILSATCLYVGKELFGWFKRKEEGESDLNNALISDLRNERKELRQAQAETIIKLIQIQERTNQSLETIAKSIQNLCESDQQHKKDAALLSIQQRQIDERLIIIQEQIKALHERLDKMNVPHSYQE